MMIKEATSFFHDTAKHGGAEGSNHSFTGQQRWCNTGHVRQGRNRATGHDDGERGEP